MAGPNVVDLKEGDCKLCTERAAKKEIRENGKLQRRCDGCGKPIPRYENMDGNGFAAAAPDHIHLGIDDKKSETPITPELCGECYVKDYAKAHPSDPVPALPPLVPV